MSTTEEKKKLIDLILDQDKTKCILNAPLYLVEGDLFEERLKKSDFLISSQFNSAFYRSSASIAFDFYKPVSQL